VVGIDWSRYEPVVGQRWPYYRPRFERFAQGKRLSWNWTAFFGTLAWLRYRRLYAWSWLYFFVSTPVLLLVMQLNSAGDPCMRALDPSSGEVTRWGLVALIGLGWVVPPLIADWAYFVHVRNRIDGKHTGSATAGCYGAVALQVLVLLAGALVFSLSHGIFQYRMIVLEGVALAAAARAPVENYVKERGQFPARLEDVARTSSGKYVSKTEIAPDGTLRVTFGERAEQLSGRSVLMVPRRVAGKIVDWTCRSDNLPDICLPRACRKNYRP
jgi:hypothetical protein